MSAITSAVGNWSSQKSVSYTHLDVYKRQVQLCTEHCLPFHYDNRYFEMQTMVGNWKIDMDMRPVRLEHINLVSQPENTRKYHVQPRLLDVYKRQRVDTGDFRGVPYAD